jgi:hypothetical protein
MAICEKLRGLRAGCKWTTLPAPNRPSEGQRVRDQFAANPLFLNGLEKTPASNLLFCNDSLTIWGSKNPAEDSPCN